ncbi:LysR substrate-binding domain-containing protein [Stutzerimonas kirkiae]|uniref:LysR family transcriptional regulator n=1 Tax=Stutzerimonas kirkiae TaxID=2211392 RepID=A0A4Q9RBK7_9GAMM|nr:LysR substrate-binding domain-containing protein [Stutzerimonas kirkiae]TBU98082.1 LysR family transcriptional regulator [Stutzerimonas kirkiae]TBV02897.1 LysR family transcriptional regulator [Stutzerimonas kirkiae]TBV09152.1 LysR family transcriptional regulator [Stutzerimonas kirkiae]TBV11133.1 LysR family transcriptional regulator [Stutzerimonas kirkiae]
MNSPAHDNTVSQRQQTQATTQANLLGELYWFIRVVEAGSFSAAAEQTGIAKSSLSRRIIQLEKRLELQLLNRNTRSFSMTSLGEQVYRHALEMLAAAEAVEACAQQANGAPSGLLRLSAPDILSEWLMQLLHDFQTQYPRVSFSLLPQDAQVELASQRLDLSLSLEAPDNSSDIVSRELASLQKVIVATPALIEALGNPQTLEQVPDKNLLALGTPPRTWSLHNQDRRLQTPAFTAQNLHLLREATKAGIGIAYLPLCCCHEDLASGTLRLACPQEQPQPLTLYALTPAARGITQAARQLIQHLRSSLQNRQNEGITPL